MKEVALVLLPFVAALGLWALRELDRFVLCIVLAAMVYPQTLVRPGGTEIAAADLLMVVAVAAWLMTNSLRASPDPYVRGNPLLLPSIVFVGVNLLSLNWSNSPRHTIIFVIQLVGIVLLTPLIFASVPRSLDVIKQG